jgi:hypothetical protein
MPSVHSLKGAKAACRKEAGLVTLDLELTSCSTHCSQLLLCVALSQKGFDHVCVALSQKGFDHVVRV